MESNNELDLGIACFNEGRLSDAMEHFGRVAEDDPGHADALHGLGMVAWMRGELDSAREMVERALALAPDNVMYLNSLGEVLRMRGEFAAAEEKLLRVLDLDPEYAYAHNNLGMLYQSQGLFAESVIEFSQAVQLAPELAMAYFNMGIAFKEMNRLEGAITAYRQAIAIKPDFVEAHVNLAIVLLLDGQLEEGFAEYEWRLRPEFTPSRPFGRPLWNGLIDPEGTLLVHTEQGYGDAIQFVRYLPFIASEGMRIILQCPAPLRDLLQGVEGVSMVYSLDEVLPDFDAHIPLLSLPLLFKTDLAKIPANVPYLFASFEKSQAWGERLAALGDTVKIGLRWAGNPSNTQDQGRSCALGVFETLAGMPRVSFVSLQNTPLTDVEKVSAERLGLLDVSSELRDFTDTAALIARLDLVISVDTSVLHLTGALGRSAWALLKHTPHWPWMLDREDCPWYPGMHLFRQQRRDDWAGVLERVAVVLHGVMQSIQE